MRRTVLCFSRRGKSIRTGGPASPRHREKTLNLKTLPFILEVKEYG
jgi:hypothetical protein